MRPKTWMGILAAAFAFCGTARSAIAAPGESCSLLTKDQIGKVLSTTMGDGKYITSTSKKTCTWTATAPGPNNTKWVTLMLQTTDGFEKAKVLGASPGVVITSASGVGDDAYYLAVGDQVGLIVKKGDVAFKVAVYATIPLDKKEAFEKVLALQVVSAL